MPSRGKRAGLAAALVGALIASSLVAGVSRRAANAKEAQRSPPPMDHRDGHARPRALAFNGDDGLLYVALSTADQVAVVDPSSSPPRLLTKVDASGFLTRSRRCRAGARWLVAGSLRGSCGSRVTP